MLASLLYLVVMHFNNEGQLFELVGKSQNILIALPKHPNPDTLGSALAFSAFLKKMNKNVEIICEKQNFENLSFLPGIDEIKYQLTLVKTFVISVDTSETKLDELSYRSEGEKINIHLKPKEGSFKSADISFGADVSAYDLIILADTPSLEQLGSLYSNNTEIFFKTPKINIDNHIGNENYGNVNLVEITAASTSEIVFELLKNFENNLIDANIATCLLTGIISKTNSFQRSNTTPDSFLRASELINHGGQQQEIIRYLFKTKDFSMLKLWGRAMARLKDLPIEGVIFSLVTAQDIEKSGAGPDSFFNVSEELVLNLSEFKLLFLAVERDKSFDVYVHSNPNIKLIEVINSFGGEQINATSGKFVLEKKIEEIEAAILDSLNNLKTRIGL